MEAAALTAALKAEAHRLGFALAGACAATDAPELARLHAWLADGRAGEMHYFARRLAAYAHPRSILPEVRSLLMLALPYRSADPQAAGLGQGRVSRYAWNVDYHDVIRDRLHALADFHRGLMPDAAVRGVVDTAPLLERQFARLAGLGWLGKNTLLLHPQQGSFFFLGALLTSEVLEYDEPFSADHCGNCRACLDACPTGALTGPYQLDARRCVSYLTIELRGPIPREFRDQQGDWLLGCDACQDVCPWNRRAPVTAEPAFQPAADRNPASAIELLMCDAAEFAERSRGTPLVRPKRGGMARNAAIALGNRPTAEALPALLRGLSDADPAVRGACAWALGKFPPGAAQRALQDRQAHESDPQVREEIVRSLAGPAAGNAGR